MWSSSLSFTIVQFLDVVKRDGTPHALPHLRHHLLDLNAGWRFRYLVRLVVVNEHYDEGFADAALTNGVAESNGVTCTPRLDRHRQVKVFICDDTGHVVGFCRDVPQGVVALDFVSSEEDVAHLLFEGQAVRLGFATAGEQGVFLAVDMLRDVLVTDRELRVDFREGRLDGWVAAVAFRSVG